MSLTGAFSHSSNFGYQAAQASVQSAARSTTSMTAVIAPNLNTNVLTDVSANIKQTGPGAAGLASDAKAGIAASAQVGSATLAAGAAAIMKCKAEITACAQANGVSAQDAYPDTAMAADSVAEMGLGIGAGKLAEVTGQGTMAQLARGALESSSVASTAADVAAGMKGKPTEEIKAAVKDTAIANSSSNWQAPSTAIIQNADATPRLPQALSTDFEALCAADDGALDKVMAFDGTDFRDFSDLQAIADNLKACDSKIAELTHIENVASIHSSVVDAVGTKDLTTRAGSIDVTSDDTGCLCTSEALAKIMGAEGDNSQTALDLEAAAQRAANASKFEGAAPVVSSSMTG